MSSFRFTANRSLFSRKKISFLDPEFSYRKVQLDVPMAAVEQQPQSPPPPQRWLKLEIHPMDNNPFQNPLLYQPNRRSVLSSFGDMSMDYDVYDSDYDDETFEDDKMDVQENEEKIAELTKSISQVSIKEENYDINMEEQRRPEKRKMNDPMKIDAKKIKKE